MAEVRVYEIHLEFVEKIEATSEREAAENFLKMLRSGDLVPLEGDFEVRQIRS